MQTPSQRTPFLMLTITARKTSRSSWLETACLANSSNNLRRAFSRCNSARALDSETPSVSNRSAGLGRALEVRLELLRFVRGIEGSFDSITMLPELNFLRTLLRWLKKATREPIPRTSKLHEDNDLAIWRHE